jgi:hypothetical protein
MDSGRGPNPNSAKRNRKTHVTALSDEAIIKQLKVQIDSQEILLSHTPEVYRHAKRHAR